MQKNKQKETFLWSQTLHSKRRKSSMTCGEKNWTKCASRGCSPCLDSIFAKLGPYFEEPLCCIRAVNIHVAINTAAVYRNFKQLQNVNLRETEWSSAWLQTTRKHCARFSANNIYSLSLSSQWKTKQGILEVWLLYCSSLQTSLCTNYTNTNRVEKNTNNPVLHILIW